MKRIIVILILMYFITANIVLFKMILLYTYKNILGLNTSQLLIDYFLKNLIIKIYIKFKLINSNINSTNKTN